MVTTSAPEEVPTIGELLRRRRGDGHISGGKVVEETGDIQVGQAWLGHSRVTTTETYSRVGERRMRQALGVLDWEADDGRPHLRVVKD